MTITSYDFGLNFLKILLKSTLYELSQEKACFLFSTISILFKLYWFMYLMS